jgi:acyl carrier protein
MNQLIQIVAEALKIPPDQVSAQMTMEGTPAWDSLAHMELIVSLEEHYRMQLTPDDMVALRSVGAIAELLKMKGLLQ